MPAVTSQVHLMEPNVFIYIFIMTYRSFPRRDEVSNAIDQFFIDLKACDESVHLTGPNFILMSYVSFQTSSTTNFTHL